MLKKTVILLLVLVTFVQAGLKAIPASPPNEGMWLPLLISRNYEEMKRLGLRLTPEQIYSINNSSLKDAIVQLGGFCTAEVVSDQGLLLTNHHCAFDAIQTHSSVEHDYLTDGFWAKTKSDELNTPGLTVSFLVRIEDVTAKLKMAGEADKEDSETAIGAEKEKITTAAEEEGIYRAEIQDMFYGNEQYLFVYQVFRDIRLVGAPPSSVGKFGGDTDNWMWPRHTGDFSMLRIYADKDNKPADYSADNVPYKPKHSLPVSIKGYKEGDYAMIMGYPGSTERYLPSSAIEQAYKNDNPDFVRLMNTRLEIMKAGMDADAKVRIQLASDYASLANSWKYFKGMNEDLQRRKLWDVKKSFEREFTAWVNADPKRKTEYGTVLADIAKNIETGKGAKKLSNFVNIAGFGPKLVSQGIGFFRLNRVMDGETVDAEKVTKQADAIKATFPDFFKDFSKSTDQKVFAAMVRIMHNDLAADQQLSIFSDKSFMKVKTKGFADQFEAYAAYVYANSMIVDEAKATAFLAKPDKKVLQNDPGVKYVLSLIDLYRNKMMAGVQEYQTNDEALMKIYMKGIREMNPDKNYSPDANFTMRLTYGSVLPYDPRDAVSYEYFTTANGVLEKEIPGDQEFDVPRKLHDLIARKDFGRYGENGELRTCFLSNTDITGGNSGSPVMNADGHLIGIAFDGNWESMSNDVIYDPATVRTISVDIRYVLFIIDKYAGAGHLVREMKLTE